ncbi:MAG: rhodanese-like domain-containing protein [Gammaproteobacteria bacterium]|nr:rhodanese-like domain-containing protein [Gammaproteobacteria bacterium]NNC98536.1 rhodanese-like domain-containing protein [Gammaproteobacteria bacterium]NNM13249.1 rhodanese-like domain-containing protein [Gammaproteobacteria bacterium]
MLEKLPEFLGNHPLWASAAFVIFALIIINEWRIRTRGFASVSPPEAVQQINQGATVLDIRGDSQFQKGHILNAVHMPAGNVGDAVKKISDKDQGVIVCCENGIQASRVASVLVKDGYANVSILRGGLQAWVDDKLPIDQ